MIHNTHVSQYIPPTLFHAVTGTWAHKAGQVTDTIAYGVTAADQVCIVNIPVMIPSNSIGLQGAKLSSVEIDFEILVAACDALTAAINKVTRGANGADAVVAAIPFTYDTGHDTAPERITVDEHKMTLNLDTPIWIDNDEYVLVKLTVDKAATTTVEFLAAIANFTLRM